MREELKNWIPYQLNFVNGVWSINWIDLDNHQAREPFFDETISLRRSAMANRSRFKSQSSLSFLLEQANAVEFVPVSAFIFHVSRCGSTLLSQALGNELQNIVMAEVPLFDEILRAAEKDKNFTVEQVRQCFIAALKFMGQKRLGQEQQYFIKLDSWHLHFYKQLRLWFPEIPFYFLSREPNAVLASHRKRRGIHAIPGYIKPELFGLKLEPVHYKNFDFYTAEVLAGYYQTISALLASPDLNNHFYDYSWGVEGMLANFFGALGISAQGLDKMTKRLAFHSKFPAERFKSDAIAAETPDAKRALSAYKKMLQSLNIRKNHG